MIFITGFMASGKSTVARILSRRMGLDHVDLDQEISRDTGSTIPEIFSAAGEKTFRYLESSALRAVVMDKGDCVVATGGGIVMDEANRACMKAAGCIVYLRTGMDTLRSRAGKSNGRPLWDKEIEALFERRKAAYEDADFIIDTDKKTPEAVAVAIGAYLRDHVSPVAVLTPIAYPVYIGERMFSGLQGLISRHLRPEGLFVLVDERVHALYKDEIKAALDGLYYHLMDVPSGEASKSYGFLGCVLDEMLETRMNRNWAVMAIGGGVTGDLSGLAASLYMRGIPVIQCPTTLLAQVDSGIGGKTAINHERGKNLVGTFHQPVFVLCDPMFLSTVDLSEMNASMGEVIKYAIIMDRELFEYLEDNPAPDWGRLVYMCSRDKAGIVSRDEKESGLRRVLNFGHTLGHAIEKSMGFTLLHGQAVAAGMAFAVWLSHDMGLLETGDMNRMFKRIKDADIIPDNIKMPSADGFSLALGMDKKGSHKGVWFVLTQGIGRVCVKNLQFCHVLDAYERYIQAMVDMPLSTV
ncbi:MAG: 3-dehydroquinate synthase [Thermodesulfobacteriota bacterium]|nr:3-dehydroquinate synthase [Thermodesulfobacteriota bacterium]